VWHVQATGALLAPPPPPLQPIERTQLGGHASKIAVPAAQAVEPEGIRKKRFIVVQRERYDSRPHTENEI